MKRMQFLITALLITITGVSQTGNNAKDYFNLSRTISFTNTSYDLAWSSHPSATYYKQEYLVKGDKVEKFKTMLLLEVVVGDFKVKDIVNNKIAELNSMKANNPMVNYEVMEKGGEIMLDFLLSQNTPDGKKVAVVERNVYRYKSITIKPGQNALLLFGVSERSYGASIETFLLKLKTNRPNLLKAVGLFTIPKISI